MSEASVNKGGRERREVKNERTFSDMILSQLLERCCARLPVGRGATEGAKRGSGQAGGCEDCGLSLPGTGSLSPAHQSSAAA